MAHEGLFDVILKAMAAKKIPERITHNDTKFNNVMLDTLTGEAKCVVDLDTVMPGCALYDFGDMVRTPLICDAANAAASLSNKSRASVSSKAVTLKPGISSLPGKRFT